ncbi:hypothetical protein PS664_05840 [Pseudomonas fluorescens]|nr:hypothetical protein PS664_05840 [Pseudomonas fluorescens]
MLAGQDGVAVALAGRAGQLAGDTALGLRGELAAQGTQLAERMAVGPGFQGGQRLAHGVAQAYIRCSQLVATYEGLLDRIGRTSRQQAVQVQRAAGFRASTRQAFAAERLHADHGTHDVTVHVDVAGIDVVDHLGDGLVDTGVHAQGQAVAGGVDLADQLVDLFTLVAHHVQYRAEDLALQLVEAFQLDQGWHHEGAALDLFTIGNRHLVHSAAFVAHGLDVFLDACLGFGVDHRADVYRQAFRVAEAAFSHGALEHFDDAVCRILLQAQYTQGRATLAGAVEGRRDYVDNHLLGQRRGVHDHRVLAAGFGDQRDRTALGIQTTGDIALQQARHFGGTGEHHAFDAIITHQAGTHALALARQQLQHAFRNTGFQQDAHGLCGHQRGLLGRLGQYRVAGGQCGCDLTTENRQREVPWADADHRAQWAVGVVGKVVAGLHGVVTQEIHGFTHFGDGVGEGLAGFASQQAHQRLDLAFHQVSGAFQDRSAFGGRSGLPNRASVDGALNRVVDVFDRGFLNLADHITQVRRVQYRRRRLVAGGATQHRRGFPVVVCGRQQGAGQRRQAVFVGQVDTRRVGAVAAVQVTRQGDTRVRQAEAAFLRSHLLDAGHWVGHQLLNGDGLVGDAIDERGVGAVFQQASYQVSQQCFVGADRCVHAARTVQLAFGYLAYNLLVQRFTHAVQALELVLAGVIVLTGDMVDGRQGMGVVRGELRVDDFWHRQQFACAGNVGNVGVHLAGVHRIAFQAFDLGALDFAVPVRTFYQADHQAMAAAARQVDDVVDHIRATFLVGLDHETDAVPAGQLWLEAQALQQVQGQLQAVGFFGVDVQADVVLLGQQGQGQQARVQLIHHTLVLRTAVTRVQCRQLDGNARAFINPTAVRGFADGVNGLFVRRQVFLGIVFGEGGFTEHVVGIAEAFGFELARVGQGFGDGFAGDELLAHQAHGHVDALADHRFAALADDAAQGRGQPCFIMGGDQFAGQQQAPGGSVDEQRRAVTQVWVPVAGADLVADQRVTGAFVRDAQQRFGQAHQRDTFLGRQGKFLQQALNNTGTAAGTFLIAQFLGNRGGQLIGSFGHRGRQAGLLDQHRYHFRLRAAVSGGDRGAQYGLRQDALGELKEALVRVVGLDLACIIGVLAAQTIEFGQGCTTLQFLQVIENRLLDQPVRRAINGGRGSLQAFAGRVVKFDPKGGRRHFLILMGATTEWHQLAARLALRIKRCNRVQPFLSMKFSTFIRNKFGVNGIRFFLVRLLLTSAVLAPKRSKNTAFCRFHI